MSTHTDKKRLRALAAPSVALVVLCFLCALCYPGAASAQGFANPEAVAAQAAEPAAPDGLESQGDQEAQEGQGVVHACPTPGEQGLLTAQPLLALGSALTAALPVVPRAGPSLTALGHLEPTAPHGYGLLTLLCVQRV
ncbi:hypothetical protein [Nocardiopsis oceani]